MAVEVKVPAVGESVREGMIETWHKKTGDWVDVDEVLLDLETDKATVEIVAEKAGVITILKEKGTVVKVGEVIAQIEAKEKAGGAPAPAKEEAKPAPTKTSEAPAKHDKEDALRKSGPAAQHAAKERGLTASDLGQGSGKDGRFTKADVLEQGSRKEVSKEAPPKEAKPQASKAEPVKAPVVQTGKARALDRQPMSMLRKRIAERLLSAQQNAAILTTFNEVDMTAVTELRNKYKDDFLKKHNLKLGFMGFFIKASVEALLEFPLVNSYIDGTDIMSPNYCDIGVAVSTEKGLMVPVIRNAQDYSILQLEQQVAYFAQKARDKAITLDDLSGGTFTVSNGGVFGSLLSTPILNPPQSAILGMHKTQMRPIVMENGTIAARPMMYLALSYDHRIIDGKEAVGFLVKIKQGIEDPARLLLGV